MSGSLHKGLRSPRGSGKVHMKRVIERGLMD